METSCMRRLLSRDTAENLDFSLLDTTAQQLAAWVIERGDEPLNSHVVYW